MPRCWRIFSKDADPTRTARRSRSRLIARLRKHVGNPKFIALGERLEKLKERHEQGLLTSLEFLKQMLELAKEVVEAEKEVDPEEERDRGKAALTELFKEVKNGEHAHHRRAHRRGHRRDREEGSLPGLAAHRRQGERVVKKALRRTLLKYKLHTDQELFDRAYGTSGSTIDRRSKSALRLWHSSTAAKQYASAAASRIGCGVS